MVGYVKDTCLGIESWGLGLWASSRNKKELRGGVSHVDVPVSCVHLVILSGIQSLSEAKTRIFVITLMSIFVASDRHRGQKEAFRQADVRTDGQIDRERKAVSLMGSYRIATYRTMEAGRRTDRPTNRQSKTHADRQIERQTVRQSVRQRFIWQTLL